MEGLIPMVIKVIKRNKIRRQYRCLSVGAAQTYHIGDFYDFGDHDHSHDQYDKVDAPWAETRNEYDGRGPGHRRYGSDGGYGMNGAYNFNYDHEEANGVGRNSCSPPKQIIKRYRSHRMFSCITGGM